VPAVDPEELKKKDGKQPAESSATGSQPVTPAGYTEIQDRAPAKGGSLGGRAAGAQPRPAALWTSDVRFQGRIVPSGHVGR
jgi:hypothetical protein